MSRLWHKAEVALGPLSRRYVATSVTLSDPHIETQFLSADARLRIRGVLYARLFHDFPLGARVAAGLPYRIHLGGPR
jgi:hypothetical protein